MTRVIGVIVAIIAGVLAYDYQHVSILFVGLLLLAIGGILLAISPKPPAKQ